MITWQSVLFIENVRTSTWVMAALLLVFGSASRTPWRGALAGLAWFFGTEVAFDWGAVLSGHPLTYPGWWEVAPLAAGLAWVGGLRVNRWCLGASGAILGAWFLSGFHYNSHVMAGFNPLDEAFNEGYKTAWGLAYLLPMLGGLHRHDDGPLRGIAEQVRRAGAHLPGPLERVGGAGR